MKQTRLFQQHEDLPLFTVPDEPAPPAPFEVRKGQKIPRPNVVSLDTGDWVWEKVNGQMFYETPKTWELWQEGELPRYLRKWNKSTVWVVNEA
jgi:hypothetical protein